MIWTWDQDRKTRTKYSSELYHSAGFHKYYLECLKDGTLPLVMIMYYDDFRKFTKLAGSSGGLYYTFANFHRDAISDTTNIFLGALVHRKDNVWNVIEKFVDQLVELYEPHIVYNGAMGKEIQVRTFLGMRYAATVRFWLFKKTQL